MLLNASIWNIGNLQPTKNRVFDNTSPSAAPLSTKNPPVFENKNNAHFFICKISKYGSKQITRFRSIRWIAVTWPPLYDLLKYELLNGFNHSMWSNWSGASCGGGLLRNWRRITCITHGWSCGSLFALTYSIMKSLAFHVHINDELIRED